MGFLSTLSQILGVGRKQVNVIVVGLDNSGKTTMLNYLRTPETRTSQIAPTVGYSVTNFTTESFSFTAFDMAGQAFCLQLLVFAGAAGNQLPQAAV
ncbi:hypothetical protein GCK32_019331 [Trichostrongylus colubriformis]|uniref:Uncharacterized protein n=1 Tax=Trichostrongylus colubriformis TaxID=6319 RepID=A0AAN8IIT5_TRICO